MFLEHQCIEEIWSTDCILKGGSCINLYQNRGLKPQLTLPWSLVNSQFHWLNLRCLKTATTPISMFRTEKFFSLLQALPPTEVPIPSTNAIPDSSQHVFRKKKSIIWAECCSHFSKLNQILTGLCIPKYSACTASIELTHHAKVLCVSITRGLYHSQHWGNKQANDHGEDYEYWRLLFLNQNCF